MSSTLNPSGLIINSYGEDWAIHQNSNITSLNGTLLTLSGLGDVETTALTTDDALQYDSAGERFINVNTAS